VRAIDDRARDIAAVGAVAVAAGSEHEEEQQRPEHHDGAS
jgi:hypothetical protein